MANDQKLKRPPAATFRFSADIPESGTYEVIVCGGGPAGVAAALAAARHGQRVLLIEATGQLGGLGTSGGISRLLGGRTPNNRQWAVGGLFREVVEALVERGGAIHPEAIATEKYNPHGGTGYISATAYGVPFDPFAMTALLDELMLNDGVAVLFFTQVIAAETDDRRIRRLIVANKSGLQAYGARQVIDATGDADIAARAGCPCFRGRDSDHKTAPASLIFTVDHVWQDALHDEIYATGSPRLTQLVARLRAEGHWPFPWEVISAVQLTEKGTLMINATRLLEVDGTDGRAVSGAMMRGRQEVQQLFAVMRAHFPGFQEARIRSVGSLLGVRESRRIVGDYVYTAADIIAGRDFDDTIGFSAYQWDMPDPEYPDREPMADRKVLRRRAHTPIPFRIMVPRPIENLLCPGRAVSVDRDALGILRVQAPCYAMGQAAGTAAALARETGDTPFRQLDTARLRQLLAADGAIVDWPAGMA